MRSGGESAQLVGDGAHKDNCRKLKHRGSIRDLVGTLLEGRERGAAVIVVVVVVVAAVVVSTRIK